MDIGISTVGSVSGSGEAAGVDGGMEAAAATA
jgi:hypothetical protein